MEMSATHHILTNVRPLPSLLHELNLLHSESPGVIYPTPGEPTWDKDLRADNNHEIIMRHNYVIIQKGSFAVSHVASTDFLISKMTPSIYVEAVKTQISWAFIVKLINILHV